MNNEEIVNKLNEIDNYLKNDLKDVLINHAESINSSHFNIDAIYELLFAIVKYPTLVLTKDEKGNVVDVELKMPKIDQDFLYKFTDYVFDIKTNTKNSKVITPEEINKMCENKIKEMLEG